MKRLKVIAGIILLLGGGAYTYFKLKTAPDIVAFSTIPSDAIYILEAQDPINNWNTFSKSNFWTFLKQHPSLQALTEDADYLDNLIADNPLLMKHLGKRSFIMSAHMISNSNYDFLFIVDSKEMSKVNLSQALLKKFVSKRDYHIFNHKHAGVNVFEMHDREAKDVLYMCLLGNQLALSYSKSILHKSIDASSGRSVLTNPKFIESSSALSSNGLCRLYLNYDYLDDYIGVYSSEGKGEYSGLQDEFSFTGLDLEMAKGYLELSGFTSVPDSGNLYTNLFKQYGNSSFSFDQILSARTAYYQAIGISDFQEFYHQLIARLTETNQLSDYNQVKRKVEKLLKLSLEDDVLSWIGGEIVVAQNLASKLHHNDDLVVAVKATSESLATEKLLKIQRQIKKRTPAKFKKYDYKNHSIFYLDIKGFFGLFFGKAFSKLTKPYYTQINDFVVFSNNPKTLVSLIDDYENGLTLENNKEYQNVKEQMPSSMALQTYINGAHAYPILGNLIKPSEMKDYRANKAYFEFFNGIGISYKATDAGFDNQIYFNFSEKQQEELPEQKTDELTQKYLSDLTRLSDAELFVLHQLNDGVYEKKFPGTNQVMLRANTKNGVFHGKFTEYNRDGTIKERGKYRRGRKLKR